VRLIFNPLFIYLFLTCGSQSQAQLPTTLHLQSSSTLGTGKASTNRERLDKLEDKETRRAIEGRAGKRKRDGDKYDVLHAGDDDDEDDDGIDIDTNGREKINIRRAGQPQAVAAHSESLPLTTQPTASVSSSVGSALRRNPDGTLVAPRIAKKRTKKVSITLG